MEKAMLKSQFLKQELSRYEKQLKALEQDKNYNDFEDKRATLKKFYESKIKEYKKQLKTA